LKKFSFSTSFPKLFFGSQTLGFSPYPKNFSLKEAKITRGLLSNYLQKVLVVNKAPGRRKIALF